MAVPSRAGERGGVTTTLVRPTRCGGNRLLSWTADQLGIGQEQRKRVPVTYPGEPLDTEEKREFLEAAALKLFAADDHSFTFT
jgi:hypothetical protein